ncbi:MAG: ribosome recycling factor [Verrucomicrobiota bacterium]
MSLEKAIFDAEESMEKAVQFMMHEFSGIRTGKASPALVETLDVRAYDTTMKLKQLALISAPEPRLLVIQPFDASTVKDIERAINESKLGINPVVDGKIIRIPIPELSEERRRDLAKTVKHLAEEARVRVRACRRDAIEAAKKLQKEGALSEDELRDSEAEVQKMTDKSVADIDKHVVVKEAELLRI